MKMGEGGGIEWTLHLTRSCRNYGIQFQIKDTSFVLIVVLAYYIDPHGVKEKLNVSIINEFIYNLIITCECKYTAIQVWL